MNAEAANKLSIARSQLLLDHPFFGVLALKLHLVENEQIPTLAVDGVNIYYNPQFVLHRLTQDTCRSAVAHEVMHCVFEHILRRGARNPLRWNKAGDYAINPILKNAGLPLGDGWLYNKAWENMSADEIYELLDDQPDSGEALCEIQTPSGKEAMSDQEVEWKLATIQAAKAAESLQKGSVPGQLRKMLDDILAPEIPWKEALAQFMTEKAKDDYSWRRPNPFYIHSGVYLPSMDGVGMGEVVIGLDTSGSVLSALDEFGATIKNIAASVKPSRVHIVYCDAAVNKVDVFERGQVLNFEAVGGGGTDFRPVFNYVAEHNIRPACLLYLTDMYGSFPETAPNYPVVWCSTTDNKGPFGDTLRIK